MRVADASERAALVFHPARTNPTRERGGTRISPQGPATENLSQAALPHRC